MRAVDLVRLHPLVSAGSMAVLLLVAVISWRLSSNEGAAVARAQSLVAQLAPGRELTTEKYIVWKQIGASDPEIRLEVARLLQQRRYAALVFDSVDLIGNTVIGLDQDGQMSRQLAETLICKTLASDPGASDQTALLYMVPWLSPGGLGSAYCASVLSGNLLGGNPSTLPARAGLLSRVLGQLPKQQATPYVAAIVDLVTSADPNDMSLLFSTLQGLDSAEFAFEFNRAAETLSMRISTAASSATVSSLFDSVDSLKLKVSPPQLALVVDAALERMLAQDDIDLKYQLYLTLLKLKLSYPDASFGARADYLMKGLHRFGNDIEIEDYSGVLRLDEQFGVNPGSEPALGSALLDRIQNLDEREYGINIKPYCTRFLEVSPKLPYQTLQRGAKLLFEQLRNEAFVVERECLHDPALVERLGPSERAELARVVLSVLEATSRSGADGSLRRVADLVELLGLLTVELSKPQLAQLKAAIAAALESDTNALGLTNLATAVTRGNFDFPSDFYFDLFVVIVNATPEPPMRVSSLLEKVALVQRSQLVDTELQTFLALKDPADVASRAAVLRVLSASLTPEQQTRISQSLMVAINDTQDMRIVSSLAITLLNPGFGLSQKDSERHAIKEAVFRRISASTEQADLAALFDATLPLTDVIDADDRAILRAATTRFLAQIVPPAGNDASVRRVTKRFGLRFLPSEVEYLSHRFMQALSDQSSYSPIANYAGSIQILSRQTGPGELDSLLEALHTKLTSTTDVESYPLLLSTWIAVESSTKRHLPPEQRVPSYNELLRLPLVGREERKLLQDRVDEIAPSHYVGAGRQFTREPSPYSASPALRARP